MEIGGSGISATLRDYGRFGLFVMNDGVAAGQQVGSTGWIAEAGTPKVLTGGNPINYSHLRWIPSSGPSITDGSFYANGIMGQQIYLNRKGRGGHRRLGRADRPRGQRHIAGGAVLRRRGGGAQVTGNRGECFGQLDRRALAITHKPVRWS